MEQKLSKVLAILNGSLATADEKAAAIVRIFPKWSQADLAGLIDGEEGFCIIPEPEVPEKVCYRWNGIEWERQTGKDCDAYNEVPSQN